MEILMEYENVTQEVLLSIYKYCSYNSIFRKQFYIFIYGLKNPCGGGVEYLHRDPASRKRRRNGAKKGRAIA
jgi:hypothetical protein